MAEKWAGEMAVLRAGMLVVERVGMKAEMKVVM